VRKGFGSTLPKQGHKIFIEEPWAGYDLCVYPNDEPFRGPSAKFGSFIEIETKDGSVLRRPAQASGDDQMTVCAKSTENAFYTSGKYGIVQYRLPTTPDKTVLDEMDNILRTLVLDSLQKDIGN